MLVWCSKQDFILKFPTNSSFFSGKQNYQSYYNNLFFTSGGCVDKAVVHRTSFQRCQYDVYFIECQTPQTYIYDVRLSQELFPVCMHTHLIHN